MSIATPNTITPAMDLPPRTQAWKCAYCGELIRYRFKTPVTVDGIWVHDNDRIVCRP